MEVLLFPDYEQLSIHAARLVADQVRKKPDSVLGLATGGTPIRTYQELVRIHREEGLSFRHVTTFNLDEYWGLPGSHPASYRYYMWEHLFRHIDIPMDRVHIPKGDAPDAGEECRRYEELLQRLGPIDLQILGIGANGHIGFNEPGTEFGTTTQLIDLSPSTIEANSRFFERQEDVPRQAISMGIKSIMQARCIILLASGHNKAEAVAQAVLGPVSTLLPASILQLHPQCLFLLDEDAASLLVADSTGLRVRRMQQRAAGQ